MWGPVIELFLLDSLYTKQVELLIERMSECVRFVREYMQSRTPDKEYGDKQVFGLMLRDFPLCIEKLARIQDELKGVQGNERGQATYSINAISWLGGIYEKAADGAGGSGVGRGLSGEWKFFTQRYKYM